MLMDSAYKGIFHRNCPLSTLPPDTWVIYARSEQRTSGMPDDEIFKHVMQKTIGDAEYWREIKILEEGPFVFRVVQEVQQGVIDSAGALKALRPIGPRRAEWICA